MSALAGPEGRSATNGGRSGAPRARQGPTPPANFKTIREKLQDTQQKVRDTQPNPCYSAQKQRRYTYDINVYVNAFEAA